MAIRRNGRWMSAWWYLCISMCVREAVRSHTKPVLPRVCKNFTVGGAATKASRLELVQEGRQGAQGHPVPLPFPSSDVPIQVACLIVADCRLEANPLIHAQLGCGREGECWAKHTNCETPAKPSNCFSRLISADLGLLTCNHKLDKS